MCSVTRNFCLPLQADESQDVLHLNYTSWPDHGVPTVNAIESILQFVLIVRQQANRTKDPIIVHCRSVRTRSVQEVAPQKFIWWLFDDEHGVCVRACVSAAPASAGQGRSSLWTA